MKTIDLKQRVRDAIRSEWEDFAAEHPRLAAVLEQELLVQRATESLANDPQYRRAMERAAAAKLSAGVIDRMIRRLARRWLERLW